MSWGKIAMLGLARTAVSAGAIFVALTLGQQDARADTWVQGGHGCGGCEVCTSDQCTCREHSCADYGMLGTSPHRKIPNRDTGKARSQEKNK